MPFTLDKTDRNLLSAFLTVAPHLSEKQLINIYTSDIGL